MIEYESAEIDKKLVKVPILTNEHLVVYERIRNRDLDNLPTNLQTDPNLVLKLIRELISINWLIPKD